MGCFTAYTYGANAEKVKKKKKKKMRYKVLWGSFIKTT